MLLIFESDICWILLVVLVLNKFLNDFWAFELTSAIIVLDDVLVVNIMLNIQGRHFTDLFLNAFHFKVHEFVLANLLLPNRFEVPCHAHVLKFHLSSFDSFFVTLLKVSLNGIKNWLNIFLSTIVEANQLQFYFMQH